MTYKCVVAIASGLGQDELVLTVACELAAAELRVVPAFPDPAADFAAYGVAFKRSAASTVTERVRAGEHEAQARLQALADAAGRTASAAVVVEQRELQPLIAATSASTLADLVVFGRHSVREGGPLAGMFAELLLSARAPILVVGQLGAAGSSVAVAWDGSAEAARAVRAALPLLQTADSVFVLSNVDDLGDDPEGGDPARLLSYLRLHGVREATLRTLHGENVAASLLEAANRDGCGVLVAGAYGRPRLYELVLGGTTRTLVNAHDAPSLILAH